MSYYDLSMDFREEAAGKGRRAKKPLRTKQRPQRCDPSVIKESGKIQQNLWFSSSQQEVCILINEVLS